MGLWSSFYHCQQQKVLLGIFLSKKNESFPLPWHGKTHFYLYFLVFSLFYRNYCFNVAPFNLTKLKNLFYSSLYFWANVVPGTPNIYPKTLISIFEKNFKIVKSLVTMLISLPPFLCSKCYVFVPSLCHRRVSLHCPLSPTIKSSSH